MKEEGRIHARRGRTFKRILVGLLLPLALVVAGVTLAQAAGSPISGARSGTEAQPGLLVAPQGIWISVTIREGGSWSGTLRRPSADGAQRGAEDALPVEGEGLEQVVETAFGRDVSGWLEGPVVLELGGPVRQGQEIEVELPANLTTGYSWAVEDPDGGALRQDGEIEARQLSPRLGAAGRQIVHLRAMETAGAVVRLAYRRPWEPDAAPVKMASIHSTGPDLQEVCAALSASLPEPPPVVDEEPPLPAGSQAPSLRSTSALPSSYNWCTDHGGCPAVRDQGACGSCWAFGTVGPLEAWAEYDPYVSSGVDLAEQYLLSCNTAGYSCVYGGLVLHNYHLATGHPSSQKPSGESDSGAVLEGDYPYVAFDDPCLGSPHDHPSTIESWAYVGSAVSVPATSAIKQAIYDHGPLEAGICTGTNFQGYTGGVFSTGDSCSYSVNHSIVLVGWNDSESSWTLRNSWGTSWGESGYMRVQWGTSNVGYGATYVVYSLTVPFTPTVTFTPTNWVYLPLALRRSPLNLANGDFDSGRDGSWSERSANGYQLVTKSKSPSALSPRSGIWHAWLGGSIYENSAIGQRIEIPPDATTLTYWYQIDSTDFCGYDYAYVRLDAATLRTQALCASNNTGGWVRQQLDISSYQGKIVDLIFRTKSDFILQSSFFVDDVSID